MSGVVTAASSLYSPLPIQWRQTWNYSSAAALFPTRTRSPKTATTFTCNCSFTPGGPGENESKIILDAFFLGKALAEAVAERIESTVGEFLSTVGRLQAEQQKQVQDFQEEVLERAKQAKEKAARETMETQGLIPNSSSADTSTAGTGFTSASAPSASSSVNSAQTNINLEDGSKDS